MKRTTEISRVEQASADKVTSACICLVNSPCRPRFVSASTKLLSQRVRPLQFIMAAMARPLLASNGEWWKDAANATYVECKYHWQSSAGAQGHSIDIALILNSYSTKSKIRR